MPRSQREFKCQPYPSPHLMSNQETWLDYQLLPDKITPFRILHFRWSIIAVRNTFACYSIFQGYDQTLVNWKCRKIAVNPVETHFKEKIFKICIEYIKLTNTHPFTGQLQVM